MSNSSKFKTRLVFQTSTRSVLLPRQIKYKNLVKYCKKKFSIPEEDNICLWYEDSSEKIDVEDDDDVECFVNDVVTGNVVVPKLFIGYTEVNTAALFKKVTDFDLNVPTYFKKQKLENNNHLHNWENNTFTNMPSPPPAPELLIKDTPRHNDLVRFTFNEGQKFDDKHACMYAIALKAIMEGFEFRVIKSCPIRYSVRCVQEGCTWCVYARRIKNNESFAISNFDNNHTCSQTKIIPIHRNATKNVIGQMIVEKMRDHKRIYKPHDIQKDFNMNWKIDISYKRAWGGKNVALTLLNGTQESSFQQLPFYFHNLKLANEGTVTHIETDDAGCFKMCFVAFGVAVRSFLSFMRSLIKIDGAHLKGTYLGTNLVAVAMDGNNQIIPIATGVSQGGTVETWTWFLTKLKECIGEPRNMAIISDRHYSIGVACKNVFPNAFHGFCCRHLLMNCKLKSKKHNAFFWKTCKAYLVSDFEKAIADIRAVKPEAYKKLEEAGFDKWSRAHCPAKRYNYMTSNCVESINALTKTVRKLPITMLMDWYRDLLQKWYYERRYVGEGEPEAHELSRWATAKVNTRMLKSATWTVFGVERFKVYQVKDNKTVHTVDLVKGECTCLKWQLSGLPCGHVCAMSKFLGLSSCNRWAKAWFSKRTLKGIYQELVNPIHDQSVWEIPNDLQVVLPPALVKPQPGRPKANDRIRSQGEEPKYNRCSRCGTKGHNRDACHVPLQSQFCENTQEDHVNSSKQEQVYGETPFASHRMHLDDISM